MKVCTLVQRYIINEAATNSFLHLSRGIHNRMVDLHNASFTPDDFSQGVLILQK